MTTLLRTLVCSLTLAAPLSAQVGVPFDGDHAIPPGPLSDAVFGAVAAGEFTGDLGVDAVVVDDGVLTLCASPETLRTAVRWTGDACHDVLALDDDRLFSCGPLGLHELLWNADAGAFDALPHELDLWRGAEHMDHGDLDGDGLADLVALVPDGAGGHRVETLLGQPDGNLASAAGWAGASIAHDVLVCDWDGDGSGEIVVCSGLGVEIHEADGTLLTSLPWPHAPVLAAVLDDPAHAHQRLALVLQAAPSANQVLVVVDQDGQEAGTGLGSLGVVGVWADDGNADGDSDLMMSLSASPEVAVAWAASDLEQIDPTEPTFDGVTLKAFGPDRDASANRAGLVAADFDHDGDSELFAPIQGSWQAGTPAGSGPYSDVCLVERNGETAEQQLSVGLDGVGWTLLQPEARVVPELTVTCPETLLAGAAGQPTLLRVQVWWAPDLWEAPGSDAVYSETFPLPAEGTSMALPIPLDPSLPTSVDTVFGWVLRQVVMDGDEVLARGPATVGVHAEGPNAEVLLELVSGETELTVEPFGGGTSIGDGGVVVGTSIPEFDEDQRPPSDR